MSLLVSVTGKTAPYTDANPPILMQNSIKERIAKLRKEIAQISEANRLHLQSGKKMPGAAGDQQRRIQRLQEILDELMSLTDWKKV